MANCIINKFWEHTHFLGGYTLFKFFIPPICGILTKRKTLCLLVTIMGTTVPGLKVKHVFVFRFRCIMHGFET